MRRKIVKLLNFILIGVLTLGVARPLTEQELAVQATSLSDIQDQINDTRNQITDTQNQISDTRNQISDTQNQLDDINDEIDGLTDEQDLVEEMIADLNSEIINTMTSIGLKEDEIATKETELADKQVEIDNTQAEYEAAKAKEEQQYRAMLVHAQNTYESGSVTTQLGVFLEGGGLSDILNRLDFIEQVYQYERFQLENYEAIKNQVHDLWDLLEQEKAGLQADKAQLETDKADLQVQKDNLDVMLEKKKQESANYEAEINRARQEAAVAKQLLQQEQQELAQLQAQQNQLQAQQNQLQNQLQAQQNPSQQNKPQQNQSNAGNTAATNGNYKPTSYTDMIEDADGSDLGKKVAKYACQYIGNPYVYGGTSLTNGADCSGFVYRVYKDFGYTLPRTSYEQRSAGKSVDYSDAEPGDLICYDGHIGIYIGDGRIVHASSERTGIKVSRATYRPILSVRRVI